MIHILAGILGFFIFLAFYSFGHPIIGLIVQIAFQIAVGWLVFFSIVGRWRFWRDEH